MRRAARVDANQEAVVMALRKIGASVAVTSQLGAGFPDLVVGIRGRNLLLEVKDSTKPPSARRLTEDEEAFKSRWRGQYAVVEKVEDAVLLVVGA